MKNFLFEKINLLRRGCHYWNSSLMIYRQLYSTFRTMSSVYHIYKQQQKLFLVNTNFFTYVAMHAFISNNLKMRVIRYVISFRFLFWHLENVSKDIKKLHIKLNVY
jgi:hypothetical protein